MTLENKESGSENPPETSQPEVAGVTAADNEDDDEITVEAELSQIRNAVRDNKIKSDFLRIIVFLSFGAFFEFRCNVTIAFCIKFFTFWIKFRLLIGPVSVLL